MTTNEQPGKTALTGAAFPLYDRFPALAALPRARFTRLPSPVETVMLPGAGGQLLVKRDDLNADQFGGNKVRVLEFLLGSVKPGDRVLTVGGEGSTHILATAFHASRLGAVTEAITWPHDMSATAMRIRDESDRRCSRILRHSNAVTAMLHANIRRIAGGVHWVPLGGSVPLGILGKVNAGLELARQVERSECECPDVVLVPMGSGGTAAGLALGFAIAGLATEVVAVRVGPRFASNAGVARRLAKRTATLISTITGEDLTSEARQVRLRAVHHMYGGAYGRMFGPAEAAAAFGQEKLGMKFDSTYSARAFAAALEFARRGGGRTLFWMTFDSRWMNEGTRTGKEDA